MIHEICLVGISAILGFYFEKPEVRDARFLDPLIVEGYNPEQDDLRLFVNEQIFPTCSMVSDFSNKWVPGAIKHRMGSSPISFTVLCAKNVCSCKNATLICVNRREHARIGYKD